MINKRRQFTKAFKADAVKLFRSSGKKLVEIAKDLGIGHDLLSRWNREYDEKNSFSGNGNPRDKEIYEYKKKIALLEEERNILKKALAIFSGTMK